MVGRHHGRQIPWDEYHGIPVGWSADEIIGKHLQMRGTFALSAFPIAKKHSKNMWYRYKAILRHLSDGVRAKDPACVELAVQYILLNHIGSYSGFFRARLARALKSADLDTRQQKLLSDHFLVLVETRNYTEEFAQYVRVWATIIDSKALAKLEALLAPREPKPEHAQLFRSATWLSKIQAGFAKRHRDATAKSSARK